MDLRKLELDLAGRRARVTLVDAAGEHAHLVDGDGYARVEAAAAPLLAALEAHLGGACHLALGEIVVDPVERRLVADGRELTGEAWLRLTGGGAGLTPLLRAAANEAGNRRPESDGSPSEARFWSEAYRTQHDGWELMRPTPPLARWVAAHPLDGKRVIVVGCGRGHEARLCARAGAQVVAVDFAPEAIAEAARLAQTDGVDIDFRQRDLFQLPRDPERYDLWLEHCCFCAIDPARRDEYVEVARQLLVEGGRLVGLFWAHGRPGGPPFSTSREELEQRFSRAFTVEHVEVPADSVALRAGQELLVELRRR